VLVESPSFRPTRRRVLALMASAGATRLFAASDFWNKKDPKDWTRDEIDHLVTNSPWAKPVTAQIETNDRDGVYSPGSPQGSPGGSTTGTPRIGLGIPGLGIPGIGGGYPGSGGGRRGTGQGTPGSYSVKGTVLWESAEPVMAAVHPDFPEEFNGHYVITLSGFPWPPRNYRGEDDVRSDQDELDRLKAATFLKPERGRSLQPGVVKQPISSSVNGSILFGFSKDLLEIGGDDKEIEFTTRLGRSPLQVRFVPREMHYRGKLAL
jgi:hypothetical protein